MDIRIKTLDERQSILIKAMRFPLICLVVFAHSVGAYPTQTVDWSLDGWNVYHFITEMLSRHLFSIGTCWFFVFSGYLFMRFLKEGEFSFQWVMGKWKKRIWTLLIPYLVWNSLAVLAIIMKNGLFDILPFGKNAEEWSVLSLGPAYWFITGPADFPLWFLRDLMLLTLLIPLMYLLFNRFKWISLVILLVVYLSPLDPTIPSMRSIFFVSIGVWLGIFKINLISISQKVKIPAAAAAIVLLLLATSQIGRPLHTFLIRLFYPCGMITFLNICNSLIDNDHRCKRLCSLSASVFFIYAAHEIYILGWTKGLLLRLFGDSLAGTWIRYWLVPIIVLTVCFALYLLLNKVTPRTLAFICGGRNK